MVLALIVMASCITKNKIEKIALMHLQDFLTISTDVTSTKDKDKLVPYLTGQMAEDLKSMTDEKFTEKFINNKIDLKKVEFIEVEAIDKVTLQVLYAINFTKPEPNSTVTDVIAEKVCVLKFINQEWKISEIYDLSVKYTFPETVIGADKKQGSPF